MKYHNLSPTYNQQIDVDSSFLYPKTEAGKIRTLKSTTTSLKSQILCTAKQSLLRFKDYYEEAAELCSNTLTVLHPLFMCAACDAAGADFKDYLVDVDVEAFNTIWTQYADQPKTISTPGLSFTFQCLSPIEMRDGSFKYVIDVYVDGTWMPILNVLLNTDKDKYLDWEFYQSIAIDVFGQDFASKFSQAAKSISQNTEICDLISTAATTAQNSSVTLSDFVNAVKSKYNGLSEDALSVYQQLSNCFENFNISSLVTVISNITKSLQKLKVNDAGTGLTFSDNSSLYVHSLLGGIMDGICTAIANIASVIANAVGGILGAVITLGGMAFSAISNIWTSTVDPNTLAQLDWTSDDRLCPYALGQNTSKGTEAIEKSVSVTQNNLFSTYLWNTEDNHIQHETLLSTNIGPRCWQAIIDSGLIKQITKCWEGSFTAYDALDLVSATMKGRYDGWYEDVFDVINNNVDQMNQTDFTSDEDFDTDVRRRLQRAIILFGLMFLPAGSLDSTGEYIYYDYYHTNYITALTLPLAKESNDLVADWKDLYTCMKIMSSWGHDTDPGLMYERSADEFSNWNDAEQAIASFMRVAGVKEGWSCEYTPSYKGATFLTTPQWSKANIILSLIIGAVVAVSVVVAATMVKIAFKNKANTIYGKVEQSWYAYTENPTVDNYKAYKKAATVNNLTSWLTGNDKVNKASYWADTGSDEVDNNQVEVSKEIIDIKNMVGA